ncbi:MAG TPA: BBP7 family outer membrane beta-barrel protein, partial [Lacipirellulaceae bacterium]|nr:BBP7 family outer membrane beta-barrel protein [Lacipirellulaceae bacterium]
CGSGYGYGGCGCNSCAPCNSTQYAWEVAWWGLDHDVNDYTRTDELTGATSHMYGMQNFNGAEYDKGSTGTWRPVNDYYDYQMPINTAPPYANGTEIVLAQRVYTNFSAQNLELNIMRFPVCDSGCGGCNSGCGSSAYDTCGCNSGCGCCQAPKSSLTMYGSCGVRYFRTDDDFSFDTEAATADGAGGYDKTMPTGDFDVCYDVNIDNNLIGPQIGWTTDYCVCCRWNFFWNSTFGIFGNHIDQSQRLWSPNGDVRFQQSGDSVDIHNSRNDIAFLGELRAGCSYDINCHWRAVMAYRAIAMTGVATAFGQIPDNFANENTVAHINTDNSLVIHGVQTGFECRY